MIPANQFKIFNVVGARPNMMKIAPIMAEMRRFTELQPILVHTGQHYDFAMSQVFLDQLEMGEPKYHLQVGSGTHHWQTAEIMKSFGELAQKERPDMIVVAGDVNSTAACAMVGAKEMIPVAHIEAGLRSFDRRMPEEINRIITDSIADLLFTTEASANENLQKEGVAAEKIFFTGNVMIDSLQRILETARRSTILGRLGLAGRKYGVLTLHRPSNVDDREQLRFTLNAIEEIARRIPVLFPIHPRTAARAQELDVPMRCWDGITPVPEQGLWSMPPTSYIDFVALLDSSAFVITDSGGIQEETTYLGVRCLTYRENTERPVTVTHGTNCVVGADPHALMQEAMRALEQPRLNRPAPPLWDGHAAERIVKVIRDYLGQRRKTADAGSA